MLWDIRRSRTRTVVGVDPEPDCLRERVDDGFDRCAKHACYIGTTELDGAVTPAHELTKTRPEVGIDFRPSDRGSFPIGSPRSVVNADQARHSEQRLACDRTAQHSRTLVVERVPPTPKRYSDVTVETARSAGIRGKPNHSVVMIDTGEMDAVVMQEHSPAIRLVLVTDEIIGTAGRYFNAPTNRCEPNREVRGECCGLGASEADRQQIDV
jgi:hypothetical protein